MESKVCELREKRDWSFDDLAQKYHEAAGGNYSDARLWCQMAEDGDEVPLTIVRTLAGQVFGLSVDEVFPRPEKS